MLADCRSIAFNVYSTSREERNFEDSSSFQSKLYLFTALGFSFLLLTLFASEWGEENLLDVREMNDERSTWYLAINVLLIFSMLGIFLLSVLNYSREPPKQIFSNYEQNYRNELREILGTWSVELDKEARKANEIKGGKRDRVRMTMANNDCMWLEIYIPQSLRMPFDECVIA